MLAGLMDALLIVSVNPGTLALHRGSGAGFAQNRVRALRHWSVDETSAWMDWVSSASNPGLSQIREESLAFDGLRLRPVRRLDCRSVWSDLSRFL